MADQKSNNRPNKDSACQWANDRAKEVHRVAADSYKKVTGDNSGVCPVKELGKEFAKGATLETGRETIQWLTSN